MNSLPPDDSQIEALLRTHAPVDLDDSGFTLRVLAALPPRRSSFARRRLVCCMLGVAAGVALAAHQGAELPDTVAIGEEAERLINQASAFLTDPRATVAFALVVYATFLAWRRGEVEQA